MHPRQILELTSRILSFGEFFLKKGQFEIEIYATKNLFKTQKYGLYYCPQEFCHLTRFFKKINYVF